MFIVENDVIPFPGYKAMNICGILFVRRGATMKPVDINHEEIHTKQMLEMLIIFFYLWYVIEWLIRFFFSKDKFTHKAYRNVWFEQEAYKNEDNLGYINERKHFAWLR